MHLDIRTLSIVTVLFAFLYAIGFIGIALSQKRLRAASFLAVGMVGFALGFLLISLRHLTSDLVSIILANILIVVGIVALLEWLLRFFRVSGQRYRWSSLAVVIITLGLFIYFTKMEPNIAARIVVISSAMAIESALCVWILLRYSDPRLRFPALGTALVFASYALYMLVRIAWTLSAGSIQDFMGADAVQALAFLFMIHLMGGVTFGFIWLITKELGLELEHQAKIDPLTGVLNRRALLELAMREMARTDRSGSPLAVIMTDIDHFKKLNDQYGHSCGDAALVSISQAIASRLRKSDILARFGGEEFIIVLPDTALPQASEVAERLRFDIQNLDFQYKKQRVIITGSFGVAARNGNTIEWETLVQQADNALYEAKRAGRNRVMLA